MTEYSPEDITLKIARRLTAIRLQKTWTREILAKKAGINIYTLKHFERTGQISLQRLVAVCQALDVAEEFNQIFKPRQRININDIKAFENSMRKRGKRNSQHLLEETA